MGALRGRSLDLVGFLGEAEVLAMVGLGFWASDSGSATAPCALSFLSQGAEGGQLCCWVCVCC